MHVRLRLRAKGGDALRWARMAMAEARTVIIGAGFAGLGAARQLRRAGIPCTVLEAGNRVGGRARTVDDDQVGTLDIGATWAHGTEGNDVYRFAEERGLIPSKEDDLEHRRRARRVFLREGGTEVEQGEIDRALELYNECLNAAENGDFSPSLSFRDALREQLGADGEPSTSASATRSAIGWRELLQGAIDGCSDVSGLGVSSLEAYEDLPGPNVRTKGFGKVASAMADDDEAKIDIRLRKIVEVVRWSEDGNVTVECQGGELFQCRSVIVAAPLPSIQFGKIKFEPQLPPWKAEALERVLIGPVEKVYYIFPEGTDERNSFNLLRKVEPQAEESVPVDNKWTRRIFSLWNDGGTILAWLTGKGECEAMANRSDEQLIDDLEAELGRFTADGSSPLKCRPERVVRSCWTADPLIGGSYSYIAPGGSKEDVRRVALSVGPVSFAGEHTHPTRFGASILRL